MDITKYEAIDEIVKYMDYPENPEERRAYFWACVNQAIQEM